MLRCFYGLLVSHQFWEMLYIPFIGEALIFCDSFHFQIQP